MEAFTCGNTGMCLTVESCTLAHDRSHPCMSLAGRRASLVFTSGVIIKIGKTSGTSPSMLDKMTQGKIVMRKTDSKREGEVEG